MATVSANATFCCLLGNNVDRGSHFTGWQLIRLLQVFALVATRRHCVPGKSFVVVSVGLLPRSLFALLSFGWGDVNLAGGSASCLLFLAVCVWFLFDLPRCMRPPVSM